MELTNFIKDILILLSLLFVAIILFVFLVKSLKYDAAKEGAMNALKEFGFEKKLKDEGK